ncbi:hypothetical protein RR42_m2344 [Cupriavidus basilensis]|uniref:Uncharacterized protein n=1 Tax=Cupriavidus basilensis TaxID=68895 RepID=A0A0C4YGD8_9BURK|nr:hypothetical protein RR42_m2344 [Cupriavidus basilensis]
MTQSCDTEYNEIFRELKAFEAAHSDIALSQTSNASRR